MPLTILVADDSVTMRNILEMTFAGEDARVVTVSSGDQVVSKAREVRPDVVLADGTMGFDGYEVAKAMKGDAALAGIPVVVMASQQNPYDEAKGRAAGVDDHLVKPFDTQSVIDRISRIAAAGASREGRAVAPAAAPAPAARPPAPPPAPTAAAARPPIVATGGPIPPGAPATRSTVAFGSAAAPPAPAPAARPAAAAPAPAPAAAARPAAAPAPAAAPRPAAAAAAVATATAAVAAKIDGLGLTPEQAKAVMELSREVVERVVWEIVPDLAEMIIREELKRLTSE